MSEDHENAWGAWFEGLAFKLGQGGPQQPTTVLESQPLGPDPLERPEPIAYPAELAPGIILDEDDDD